MIEVRQVTHGSVEYAAAVQLRREILRLPLGLDFTSEQLDGEAPYVAALSDGLVVGTLLLVDVGNGVYHMRQVAVSLALQSQGIGRLLVEECERIATSYGFRRMILHARDTAVPFYLRLGYTVEGELFEEVSIPHRKMVKELHPST